MIKTDGFDGFRYVLPGVDSGGRQSSGWRNQFSSRHAF
jgi:hypothetical protein